jgi:hypothetical protein
MCRLTLWAVTFVNFRLAMIFLADIDSGCSFLTDFLTYNSEKSLFLRKDSSCRIVMGRLLPLLPSWLAGCVYLVWFCFQMSAFFFSTPCTNVEFLLCYCGVLDCEIDCFSHSNFKNTFLFKASTLLEIDMSFEIGRI